MNVMMTLTVISQDKNLVPQNLTHSYAINITAILRIKSINNIPQMWTSPSSNMWNANEKTKVLNFQWGSGTKVKFGRYFYLLNVNC